MGCAASNSGHVASVKPLLGTSKVGAAAGDTATTTTDRILVIDCDSTLTHIEGIDEAGRLRGEAVFKECEHLTRCAMDATMSIAETVRRRIALIQPSRDFCKTVSEIYKQNPQPGVREVLHNLRQAGWHIVIVSGGFRQCILPFAESLGVKDPDDVHATDLTFDEKGNYVAFDETYPGTREFGKQEVVNTYLERYKKRRAEEGRPVRPITVVMVGDGKSDLEVRTGGGTPPAEFFIAYAGVIARKHVVAEADAVAYNWTQVQRYLNTKYPPE
jgi:phosphoserine phosphatase